MTLPYKTLSRHLQGPRAGASLGSHSSLYNFGCSAAIICRKGRIRPEPCCHWTKYHPAARFWGRLPQLYLLVAGSSSREPNRCGGLVCSGLAQRPRRTGGEHSLASPWLPGSAHNLRVMGAPGNTTSHTWRAARKQRPRQGSRCRVDQSCGWTPLPGTLAPMLVYGYFRIL